MSSISLTDIGWSTPSGHSVLQDIDLTLGRRRTGLVGRNGVDKSTLPQLMAGDLTPSSGTISKVRALHLMRQIVQPAHTNTIADLFGIREALDLLARAASGEATPEDLADADWMLEERIALALARLDLEACAATPLAGLSGGQRRRAALAAFNGALLVVSHDEAFLHEIGIERRIVLAS